MADSNSIKKAKAKIQKQITKSEQNKRIAEFEKQEARRIQGLKIAEEKAKQKAEFNSRKEEIRKNRVQSKNEASIQQIKNSLSYAERESLNVTVGLSLVIMFITYLFVFS